MNSPNALIGSDYGPIIINVHDAVIGRQIAQTGYWARDDIELMKQLIQHLLQKKPEVVIYDVGANIGTHALALGRSFGGRARVRAFEAQRQFFQMLCGTMALNGLSNVWCHHLAVSDRDGETIRIAIPDYDQPNNFGGLELVPALRSDNQTMRKVREEEVLTTTLDRFDEPVDFIKLDIEGMEDKALAGATRILEQSRPICFIEILKTDVDALLRRFGALGYAGFQKNADLIAIPLEHQIGVNGLQRLF